MTIRIETEQIAYPLDSEFYPMIRVFESPYSVGDCPVDEAVLNTLIDPNWESYYEGTDMVRAFIADGEVAISSIEGNEYTEGASYEIRIYASDEVVATESTETTE